ncbi:Y-family DNA polymerase [Mycoplasma tauri]|uniref:Y-family DNA polymerase n=1 Tax=Mycoplasma tauri TaxID=547987 RepID=UPI001CBE9EEC|nr:DNA polymerase IV [Mycoplasma tauri]MBZ4226596.1 DNA polymerase IV [Mycoplasma tauri]
MKDSRIIFHIDFDSYFVSAHRSKNTNLKNWPVAVSKDLDNSICTSISYELKNLGIKVGWPKYMIIKKAPKTIFVKPNFTLYTTISNNIFDYLSKKYTKNIEVSSIDECWMDVTDVLKGLDPVVFARKIQYDVLKKFDIPISIGISHTKWAAKISSDLAKPFGVKYVNTQSELENYIWPLDIIDYYGIGEKTAIRLRKIGIKTISNLARSSALDVDLYKIFKSRLKNYIDEANGNGSDKLEYSHNELKNIGHELTFAKYNIDDRHEIHKIIKDLVIKVCHRAKNRNIIGSTLTIVIKNTTKSWTSKQKKISKPSNDENFIYNSAINLFDEYWNEQPIKGVGVRLTNLIDEFNYYKQLSIFENDHEKSQKIAVNDIINHINLNQEKEILKTGYQVLREKTKKSIQNRFLEEDVH